MSSVVTPAFADPDGEARVSVYRRIMQDRTETLRTIPSKIQNHPVGKAGKAVAWKFAAAAAATLAMLAASDIKKQLEQENVALSREAVEKKAKEFDDSSNILEDVIFSSADSALLVFPMTAGLEGLANKFPAFAEKKIAGQLLHSFIIGLTLSSIDSWADQMVLLTCDYMFKHPNEVGELTREEKIEIIQLQKNIKTTFIAYGIVNGSEARKSAFTKLVKTLFYHILWKDSHAAWILISNATRDYWLNGKTWINIGSAFVYLPIKNYLIPAGTKNPVLKAAILSALFATTISSMIPDWFEDDFSSLMRLNWAQIHIDHLKKLSAAQSDYDVVRAINDSTSNREDMVTMALSVAKIANDKIEIQIADQRLTIRQKPGSAHEIIAKNAPVVRGYQDTVRYAFDTIIKRYVMDKKTLMDFQKSNPNYWPLVAGELNRLNALEDYMKYFKEKILNQYQALDPLFSRDNLTYTETARKLDRLVMWHFIEKDIRLLQK